MTRDARDGSDVDMLDFTDAASTFGDRLALAREAAGLDQAQLARRIGVRPETLRNWEDDRSEPRANRVQMLAGMLDVSMIWLMSGMGPAPEASAGETTPEPAALACLADLRGLRVQQAQLAERLGQLERRLRALLR